MTIAAIPDLVEAPSWSIRPELPIDLDQIHDLHRAAFRRSAEAELVDAIRSGADFIRELSLVAVATDGSVLGHVLVSRIGFDEDGAASRLDVLALAPLAVLPPHWGRGIGSALTNEVLSASDARDEPFVVVLGSPDYYARFGFEPAVEYGINGPYDGAGDAFQVRGRGGATPSAPGTVVYPAMFDGI